MKKLRIAQVSPLWYPVPPPGYGGTEQIVSLLTEELVKRGHDVTLFASGDSQTRATLVSTVKKNLVAQDVPWLSAADNLRNLLAAFARAGEFDIVHTHIDVYDVLFPPFVSTPAIATLHNPFWPLGPENEKRYGDRLRLYEDRKAGNYVAISDSYRAQCPVKLDWTATIHHGIPMERYTFFPEGSSEFVWLGRISPTKGLHIAAKLCKEQGFSLRIGGRFITKEAHEYWEKEVAPFVDGTRIRYEGEIAAEDRASFLGSARALLYPLQWEEPFGLVMLEALASGTPVIAFRRGAAPEIIQDNVTGFLVNDAAEMLAAMDKIGKIDRATCRTHAEENFTVEKMTDKYEEAYQKILAAA